MKNNENNLSTASSKKSLIACSIGSIPTASTGISRSIIPKSGVLPAGSYTSTITEVADVIVDGVCVAVDFLHELIDAAGRTRLVRFRVFESELAALLQIFASYGLTGSLSTALPGLREEVTVQPRTNSSYLHIAARTLLALPNVIPVSPSTTPQKPSLRTRLGSKHPAHAATTQPICHL